MSHSDSPFSLIFSDNSNIMLAAIISLLLVILFVLLLHLYAKWFLAHSQSQARRRRRHRRRPVTVSRFHHFHTFNLHDSPLSTKGLDSAAIAAIPVFIYQESDEYNDSGDCDGDDVRDLECVICLTAFGDGQIGRSLPKCGHAFHMDCIDMWFASHSNCPICRAPINTTAIVVVDVENRDSDNNANSDELDSVVTGDNDHDDNSSALLEIVIDSPNSNESIIGENNNQIVHESSGNNVSSSSINSENNNNERVSDDDSETSFSSLLLASSLKRMLSKVFLPSSDNNVHHSLNQ